MARSLIVPALALALTMLAAPASAQVYRWVDAQGQVHYGDVASAPRSARLANIDTPPPASDRSYLAHGTGVKTDASTPGAPTPEPEVAQDEGSAQACEVARRNRSLLADVGKDVLDDSGKQVMTAPARAQRLARVDLEIEAFCNVLGSNAGARP